jgi:hypothetical protein
MKRVVPSKLNQVAKWTTAGCCILAMVLASALGAGKSKSTGKPSPAAAPVKVNRTVPTVQSPKGGLQFSAKPTLDEIFRARIFAEPLVPIGGQPSEAENAALASALTSYSKRSGPDDFSSLTGFLEKYSKSPWRAALLTDLGLEYYNTAH